MFAIGLFPLGGVVPMARQQWPVGDEVREAMRLAGLTPKEAAFRMGVTEASLSRMLAGTYADHITEDGLSCLGAEFTVWHCAVKLRRYGLFPGTRELVAGALVGGIHLAQATFAKESARDRECVVA